MSCHQNNRYGLSLVEVIVSSMLVGMVVVGSLSMLGASIRTKRVNNNQQIGPLLADQLLAEIMSMPYEDPQSGGGSLGTETGEGNANRMQWDDVDDYKDWDESPPRTKDNTILNQYAGWTRAASVSRAERNNVNWWFQETGLKRIVVTVTSPPPESIVTKRFGLRSRDGSLEQPFTGGVTVIRQMETVLSAGSADEVRGVTNLLNHVEDPNP